MLLATLLYKQLIVVLPKMNKFLVEKYKFSIFAYEFLRSN